MVHRRNSRQRNIGLPLDLPVIWHEHGDALATFGFVTLMALLALAMSPAQEREATVPESWFDFLESNPESPYEAPNLVAVEKELELDLPFVQEVDEEGNPTIPTLAKYYTIKRGDTLGAILRRITEDKAAITYLVTQKLNSYRKLRRGRQVEYEISDAGKLTKLRYKASPDLHMTFTQGAAGAMQVSEGAPELVASIEIKTATITTANNSLFAASDAAGVPDAVIQAVIDALETRIDFQRDTRLDDRFSVIYEKLVDSDGDDAGTGRMYALRFINQGKTITGLLNADAGGYFEPSGESLQRAFLRSPLKFTRISSRYTKRRFHPVLKKWRSHRGVDFAAPTNTPVRSSADGVVDFIGKKGGYGNVVMIKHFDKYLTVYGHLNKFAKSVRRGSRVSQGQLIGYVGSTGLATGPHLHYEFRIGNEYKDPLSTAVPTNKPPLEGAALAQFLQLNQEYISMLNITSGP